MPQYLVQPCPLPTPSLSSECMMPRCLAQPCFFSLSVPPLYAVVRGLSPLG